MIGPIYFVTDPDAPLPVVEQVRRAVKGGAQTIQLRHKTAPDSTLRTLLCVVQSTLPANVQLVINDRVDLAIEAGIWGLHIGQGDGDPREIRARIGPDMVLGLSVENEEQLAHVPRDCVDYLGVGPVRATATKPDHAPPTGFAGLAGIVARAGLPCVAIGGLGLGDCAEVKQTGAVAMAVVSAIARAQNPEEAARKLKLEWSMA